LENDKTDEGRVQTQMYVALQIAAALSSLCEPFLPFTAKIIWNFENRRKIAGALFRNFRFDYQDTKLVKQLLLPKLKMKKSETNRQTRSYKANKAENKVVEPEKSIQFDDFSKMDMRVGTIIEASKCRKQTSF
jgi:methionyl-tRNA synthetase